MTDLYLHDSVHFFSLPTPYDCMQNMQVHVMLVHPQQPNTASQTSATGFKQVKEWVKTVSGWLSTKPP